MTTLSHSRLMSGMENNLENVLCWHGSAVRPPNFQAKGPNSIPDCGHDCGKCKQLIPFSLVS